MNIDKMPAGQDMDKLVAERVMGWVLTGTSESPAWHTPDGLRTWEETSYRSFRPSLDVRAMWEVVEKLDRAGRYGTYNWFIAKPVDKWQATLSEGCVQIAKSEADTAPLAVCRTALKIIS